MEMSNKIKSAIKKVLKLRKLHLVIAFLILLVLFSFGIYVSQNKQPSSPVDLKKSESIGFENTKKYSVLADGKKYYCSTLPDEDKNNIEVLDELILAVNKSAENSIKFYEEKKSKCGTEKEYDASSPEVEEKLNKLIPPDIQALLDDYRRTKSYTIKDFAACREFWEDALKDTHKWVSEQTKPHEVDIEKLLFKNNCTLAKEDNRTPEWNTKIADKYNDEPEFDYFKISSSSAWVVPADPETVKVSSDNLTSLGRFVYEQAQPAEVWDKWPTLKEKLDKLNLDKKYYDYFLKAGQLPTVIKHADVNGDGKEDKLFLSIGVGCASCHTHFIDIFVNDKRYATVTNNGGFYVRNDGKGFYIDTQYMGKDFATCCPDRIVIGKFEWNGDGFTEVARKNIWITPTEQ